jgi:DNA-binding beta-propeller fold protein YncE
MRPLVPLTLLAALSACSSELSLFRPGDADDGGDDTDWAPVDTDFAPADDTDTPSETEEDDRRLRPAETDVFVFIANPDDDSATRVNVGTLEVRTVDVGDRPTLVLATRDHRTAVVFNQGDDTLTLLDAASLAARTIPIRRNLNRMVLSPDSRWVLLWHDLTKEDDEDVSPGGAVSFNEMSIVEVSTGVHHPLVVGFSPREVAFTPDGTLALAIADAWLATLDLSGDAPVPAFLPIADPLTAPRAEEVEIAADGSFAFIRQLGVDALTVVDLSARSVSTLPVGAEPTDLDLTDDGTRAVLVSRGARQVAVFDVADPFAPPITTTIAGDAPLGSILLAPDDSAVLYTNASALNRYATWDVGAPDMILHPLPKPVETMVRTPTGGSLLAIHGREDNPDGSTPEAYRNKNAISLIDLGDLRANTLVLDAAVSGFANSADGGLGYAIMEGVPWLEILDYRTLIFDEVALRSSAVFVGVLPDLIEDDDAPPAWVSQDHALGRITFYDPDDATPRTITGFALNGEIED